MKTALQELLSWAKHPIEDGEVNHSLYSKINELLEKEKQQIEDAYEDGHKAAIYFRGTMNYFKEKYNQNETNI